MASKKAAAGRGDYKTVGVNVQVHLEDMPRDLASARHEAELASRRGGRAEVRTYHGNRLVEAYEGGRKVKK